VRNGRFRPLSVHSVCSEDNADGSIVAWRHRVDCDEITAFQDPVRYKGGGEKDFLAMRARSCAPTTSPTGSPSSCHR